MSGGARRDIQPRVFWTQERCQTALDMWAACQSAGEIALVIGVTRNAVIGKLRRLGAPFRTKDEQARNTKRLTPRPYRDVRPTLSPKPRHENPRAMARNIDARRNDPGQKALPKPSADETPGTATVLTLGAHMCKWPIGDPALDGFTFCGRRSEKNGPYCAAHAARAFQSVQTKPAELARSLRRYI